MNIWILQNKNQAQPHEAVGLEGDEEEEEEAGEEAHSPLEQDSLMPSDEASDSLSRGHRGSPCHRGVEEEEEEEEEDGYASPCHARTYRDMYPSHHGHAGSAHSTNGHESQDRLLQREAQQGHNQRNNRQRSRPWPRDTYWNVGHSQPPGCHQGLTHPHSNMSFNCHTHPPNPHALQLPRIPKTKHRI